MASDDSLITLSELLLGAPSRQHSPASAGAGRHVSGPAAGAPLLSASLAKELSAVDGMFARWQEDVERKRRERQAVRDFADEAGFRAALLVVNKRGERRRGARAAQEWYYVARSAARHSGDLPCTHCRLHIQRRATYFVDRAAEAQADEVCRPCMLCVMRRLLGHDDGAILAEAQAILDSAWSPSFSASLLGVLPPRRTLLADF